MISGDSPNNGRLPRRKTVCHFTMKTPVVDQEWGERTSAPNLPIKQTDTVFESFFERTSDAVWLFDPQVGVFLDCNQAAVDIIGAKSKEELLQAKPEDLSPLYQPCGMTSRDRSAEVVELIEKHKCYRFEWIMRHRDGHDVPIEVSCTAITMGGRRVNVVISRDITERKKAEQEALELNQSLERRVAERTAALTTSEARFRALVEHAPEAIVLFDGVTGRFLFGNEHASRLYGVPMEK
jgi:PAS domain S-box-containing protein